MCGIVGFVGSEQSAEFVVAGLKRLEYRGYDSAGVATLDRGRIVVKRRRGKLVELAGLLQKEPLTGTSSIGHTRWATHGRPSDENAHPHQANDVVVVHNGIIENYQELRADLQKRGRQFLSETDTEVLAHLIAVESGTLEERVRQALQKVRGAYAIAVMSEKEPDTIVAAKNASPLILGIKEGIGLLASDIPALLPYTRQVVIMQEGEMAVLKTSGTCISTLDGKNIHREAKTIDWTPVMAEKAGHKHFMHKEIHEQPRAVLDTLRGRTSLGNSPDLHILPHEPWIINCAQAQRVVLTGCGTSFHAGLVGRLAIEDLAGMGVEVELASELRYRQFVLGPETLTIAVSQSGETADTLAALRELKARGTKILSIVNVVDSSIARESDWTLYTQAGPEIGVASTKAFITQVTSLYLLALALGQRRLGASPRLKMVADALAAIPDAIEKVLLDETIIQMASKRIVAAPSVLFIGRGYGFPVALEGALKLKEISYIHAEGYAAGELKHGPIALIERGTPVVAIATQGPLYEKVLSNIQEVRAREAYVIAVATRGDQRIQEIADNVFYVPEIEPMLVPLVATIPLQLLAYHVADLRGTDIDQPRNLAKSVTVE